MVIWKHSELTPGEHVCIPESMFVQDSKRLIYTEYIGETSQGILIKNHFRPGIGTENPNTWEYVKFIDWPAIYCGQIKVRGELCGEVRAIQENPTYVL